MFWAQGEKRDWHAWLVPRCQRNHAWRPPLGLCARQHRHRLIDQRLHGKPWPGPVVQCLLSRIRGPRGGASEGAASPGRRVDRFQHRVGGYQAVRVESRRDNIRPCDVAHLLSSLWRAAATHDRPVLCDSDLRGGQDDNCVRMHLLLHGVMDPLPALVYGTALHRTRTETGVHSQPLELARRLHSCRMRCLSLHSGRTLQAYGKRRAGGYGRSPGEAERR
mmetsp:Transcript_13672/g.36828  ORF Transcript_13672/g.36828 Transcript_13672/m.36828 type:complete len:220 (-) Transcript_13672:1366-2025(-)